MRQLLFIIILFFGTSAYAKNIFLLVTSQDSVPRSDSNFVPQWAKGVVWYQIFPERFRNGDTTNDPTLKSIEGLIPTILIRHGRFIPGLLIFINCNPMKRKMEKIYGIICRDEDMEVTYRE